MSAGTTADSFSNEPLRYPAFRRFLFARIFTTTAFATVSVSVGWEIYALTHSALALGLIGIAQFIPMLLFALPAGHFADTYDRRTLARNCQWIAGGAAAVLAAAVAFKIVAPAVVYGAILLLASARIFEVSTMQALTATLIPSAIIPNAAARSASANQLANLTGPAVGGLLYTIHPFVAYSTAFVLYAIAGILVWGIRREDGIRKPTTEATLDSIFDGLHFIRARPIIFGAISLDLFAVLFGGVTALLPIYAKTILQAGPWGLGILQASPALGAIAISLLLARRPPRKNVGAIMFATVILFGIGTILFAVSRTFAACIPLLAVMGATNMVSVVIRNSLVQIQTPDEMRGRVYAVNQLFSGSANQLGAFESGLTASWFGTAPSVVIGGVGTIVVALLWIRLFPPLARARTLEG